MSKTRKDLSWSVLAMKDGIIEHNHTKGECVVGTWTERHKQEEARRLHRKTCVRYTYVVECLHDHKRTVFQRELEYARKISRLASSEKISLMLDEGYFPNCNEAKTHKVDLETLEMGFLPEERYLEWGHQDIWNDMNTKRRKPERVIFGKRFDPTAKCKTCDTVKVITCMINPKHPPGENRGCSCCTYPRKVELTKTRVRASLRNEAKEYNSQVSEEN